MSAKYDDGDDAWDDAGNGNDDDFDDGGDDEEDIEVDSEGDFCGGLKFKLLLTRLSCNRDVTLVVVVSAF